MSLRTTNTTTTSIIFLYQPRYFIFFKKTHPNRRKLNHSKLSKCNKEAVSQMLHLELSCPISLFQIFSSPNHWGFLSQENLYFSKLCISTDRDFFQINKIYTMVLVQHTSLPQESFYSRWFWNKIQEVLFKSHKKFSIPRKWQWRER